MRNVTPIAEKDAGAPHVSSVFCVLDCYFQMNGIGDFRGKIGKKLVGKLVKTVYQLLDAKFAGFYTPVCATKGEGQILG